MYLKCDMTSVKQWIKIGKQMNWIIFFEKVGMDRTIVWVKRSMIICVKGEIMYFESFFSLVLRVLILMWRQYLN